MRRSLSQLRSANKPTLYTINDEICPPLDRDVLRTIVAKHCQTLDRFLTHKPIAKHTLEAFQRVQNSVDHRNIILDSGCGTGRSSLLLGEMYPSHFVIGIDRSVARLVRNVKFRKGQVKETNDNEEKNALEVNCIDNNVPTVQRAAENVLLVRAELVDFWRLALQQNWNVSHHYLLYPNPYPKKSRYKHRWYANPSFPLLLQLGGNILIRSNWKAYLEEFGESVVMCHEYCQESGIDGNYASPYVKSALAGPTLRTDKILPLTNFEAKYDAVGEPTYELKLEYMSERGMGS